MSFAFNTLPDDVTLGALSRQVFDVLSEHTSFPWPIMQAQCRREGVDPTDLSAEDLALVLPHFGDAVARFTSPSTGQQVRAALQPLAARSAS